MIEQIYYVRSYSIAPDVRGSPKLTILTDKKRLNYNDKVKSISFIIAADGGCPFKVKLVERETPTGGKYEVFERVEG